MKGRCLVSLVAAMAAGCACAAVDFRPAFDKSGAFRKVWVQANPWFPFDMKRESLKGGPNVAWRKFQGPDVWAQGFADIARYGVDGVFMEVNEPIGMSQHATWLRAAEELARGSVDFKIAPMFAFFSKTEDEAIGNMRRILGAMRKAMDGNPRVLRLGGRPVVSVYQPHRHPPEFYGKVFSALDEEFGPFVYLMCYSSIRGYRYNDFERQMWSYIPYFDGVWSYAYSMESVGEQRIELEVLERLMKAYPQKLYCGGPFAGYMQHFNPCGLEARLSSEWRQSVDLWLGSSAEAIEITNLFDHYENSLVLPCYEREDLLLRYLEWALSKWRGTPFRAEKTPELVLCGYQQALVGWRSLDFEVLGFPVDDPEKEVSVGIELCDPDGKVLRRLGPERMALDAFRAVSFSVPSEEFADMRAVKPRLVWEWKGERHLGAFNPMTFLMTSLNCYRLYWARSTRNAGAAGVDRAPEPLPFWWGRPASGRVEIPMMQSDGTVANRSVESVRVPFFHYPCDRDAGNLVEDVSGYRHHAWMNGAGFGGGHLNYTGYFYEHDGIPAGGLGKKASRFRRDADGRGYLDFSGDDALMMMGATAMPGASTYELAVRPADVAQDAGLLGSGRGQIGVDVLSNGCVRVSRRELANRATLEMRTVSCVSREPLPRGKWTRLGVVYDLRDCVLYFDGREVARMAAKPNFFHEGLGFDHRPFQSDEFYNNVVVGAGCQPPYRPVRHFRGGIRQIRISGRNLAPGEFLPD